MLNQNRTYLVLLLLCLGSRILTSIFYIEDIDSLRFALSIKEFDINKLQPHFPGYPVYCFFLKILYQITKNTGISFSILGGISVYIIIIYVLRICRIELKTRVGIICCLIIFFNPIIWIMSNRYMPDLFGLSILVVSTFYLIYGNKKTQIYKGYFLTGLLAGIRISYLPFLFAPIIYTFINEKNKLNLALALLSGIFLWAIPFTWITGVDSLLKNAFMQVQGHFTNFGGTILTDTGWTIRMKYLILGIWSDGFGGYWVGRSLQTIPLSITLLYLLNIGFSGFGKYYKFDQSLKILLISTIIYLFWIYFFQNVIYKSRHVLPLLIIIFVIIVIGQKYIFNTKGLLINIIIMTYLITSISITTQLVFKHKNPNAIAKLKDSVSTLPVDTDIISFPLINFYLKSHGLKNNFININNISDFDNLVIGERENVYVIGNFDDQDVKKLDLVLDEVFFHNPYVNRMWSELRKYRLQIIK